MERRPEKDARHQSVRTIEQLNSGPVLPGNTRECLFPPGPVCIRNGSAGAGRAQRTFRHISSEFTVNPRGIAGQRNACSHEDGQRRIDSNARGGDKFSYVIVRWPVMLERTEPEDYAPGDLLTREPVPYQRQTLLVRLVRNCASNTPGQRIIDLDEVRAERFPLFDVLPPFLLRGNF